MKKSLIMTASLLLSSIAASSPILCPEVVENCREHRLEGRHVMYATCDFKGGTTDIWHARVKAMTMTFYKKGVFHRAEAYQIDKAVYCRYLVPNSNPRIAIIVEAKQGARLVADDPYNPNNKWRKIDASQRWACEDSGIKVCPIKHIAKD